MLQLNLKSAKIYIYMILSNFGQVWSCCIATGMCVSDTQVSPSEPFFSTDHMVL